ncbi:MAG: VWA domain-containing protein [Planctomycetota bacterium]
MLTFAHPWLLLLAPIPWLVRALLPPTRASAVGVRVPFLDRIERASAGRSAPVRGARVAALVPVWLLVLASLARPQWVEPPLTREMPTRDLLLLVDLSTSMDVEDFTSSSGESVDRLTAVREVLADFLGRRDGDRVGLVVFGSAPFVQAPFSIDLTLVDRLLDEVETGMAGPRTAFGDAIGLGLTMFESSDAPAKTIIALTDGNDTASQVPPIEAARVARERGVRVHTVAIGDPTTAGEDKLDEEALRSVAETAGGSYFFAADRTELMGIYAELDRIETVEVEVASFRPRRDLFYLPLLAALLVSLVDHALRAAASLRGARSLGSSAALRVDPLTGALEVES